jgi:hypothetical protein
MVREHPDWTGSDVESAMKRAGARFPESERSAFVQALDFNSLSAVFGSSRGSSVRFVWHGSDDETQLRNPSWVVTVEGERGGVRRCYSMTFEPFTGRLLFLKASACSGK